MLRWSASVLGKLEVCTVVRYICCWVYQSHRQTDHFHPEADLAQPCPMTKHITTVWCQKLNMVPLNTVKEGLTMSLYHPAFQHVDKHSLLLQHLETLHHR